MTTASEKIKHLLRLKGMTQKDLAEHFNMSPSAMRNKFAKGSFNLDDLIRIAGITGAPLGFEISANSRITFDKDDIRPEKDDNGLL